MKPKIQKPKFKAKKLSVTLPRKITKKTISSPLSGRKAPPIKVQNIDVSKPKATEGKLSGLLNKNKQKIKVISAFGKTLEKVKERSRPSSKASRIEKTLTQIEQEK